MTPPSDDTPTPSDDAPTPSDDAPTPRTDARIEGVGAYAPRYRLAAETVEEAWGAFHGAGIATTAVPDADEDVLTMAAEAASLALSAATTSESGASRAAEPVTADVDGVDRLYVGTTTPPDEEEGMGPRLASVLGLPADVEVRQFAGGTRAGVDALTAALDADGSRSGPADAPGRTLVIASDAPQGAPDDPVGHASGAGAAAVVVGPDGDGRVTARAEHVEAIPGTRFRPPGSDETTGIGVTGYERRAFVDTVAAAADALTTDAPESTASEADAVCLRSPNGKLPYRAAGALGVDPDRIREGTTVHDLGDTGAADVLLGFASTLDAGHEDVLLVGYGSGGGATALSVDAAGVPSRTALDEDAKLSYAASLRMHGAITTDEPEGGGAYVSVPSWKRTLPQRHRLIAGRCRECGALAFPPSGACTDCGALDDYEEVQLPGTGTVEAVTTIGQGGAPPEFVEQQARSGAFVSAVVALDGPDSDGHVSIPAQVITPADGAAVDAENTGGADVDEDDTDVGDDTVVDEDATDVDDDADDDDLAAVAIGDRVEATIRRIYTQEGVTRYGFKMRPLRDVDE